MSLPTVEEFTHQTSYKDILAAYRAALAEIERLKRKLDGECETCNGLGIMEVEVSDGCVEFGPAHDADYRLPRRHNMYALACRYLGIDPQTGEAHTLIDVDPEGEPDDE